MKNGQIPLDVIRDSKIDLLFWPLLPVTIYGIYKRTQN